MKRLLLAATMLAALASPAAAEWDLRCSPTLCGTSQVYSDELGQDIKLAVFVRLDAIKLAIGVQKAAWLIEGQRNIASILSVDGVQLGVRHGVASEDKRFFTIQNADLIRLSVGKTLTIEMPDLILKLPLDGSHVAIDALLAAAVDKLRSGTAVPEPKGPAYDIESNR